MKNHILAISVMGIILLGFIAYTLDPKITGQTYRTVRSATGMTDLGNSGSVGNRYFLITAGKETDLLWSGSPRRTGISFLTNKIPEGKGDVNGDGVCNEDDFRYVSRLYQWRTDVPNYGGKDRLNFAILSLPGDFFRKGSRSRRGIYDPKADLNDNGIIDYFDVQHFWAACTRSGSTQTLKGGVIDVDYLNKRIDCSELGRLKCGNDKTWLMRCEPIIEQGDSLTQGGMFKQLPLLEFKQVKNCAEEGLQCINTRRGARCATTMNQDAIRSAWLGSSDVDNAT